MDWFQRLHMLSGGLPAKTLLGQDKVLLRECKLRSLTEKLQGFWRQKPAGNRTIQSLEETASEMILSLLFGALSPTHSTSEIQSAWIIAVSKKSIFFHYHHIHMSVCVYICMHDTQNLAHEFLLPLQKLCSSPTILMYIAIQKKLWESSRAWWHFGVGGQDGDQTHPSPGSM